MFAAQAIIDGLSLVSQDSVFASFPNLTTLW